MNTMNTEELVKKGTLIDVREEIELLTDGKINNALNIPLGEIESKLEEIKKLPTPIVLFCRSGVRAGKAMEFLKSKGIETVYNVQGYNDIKDLV